MVLSACRSRVSRFHRRRSHSFSLRGFLRARFVSYNRIHRKITRRRQNARHVSMALERKLVTTYQTETSNWTLTLLDTVAHIKGHIDFLVASYYLRRRNLRSQLITCDRNLQSSFQMTVESNYVIAIATLSDWLKRRAPVFQPMRRKIKTIRTMYA